MAYETIIPVSMCRDCALFFRHGQPTGEALRLLMSINERWGHYHIVLLLLHGEGERGTFSTEPCDICLARRPGVRFSAVAWLR